jgi:transposase
MKKWNYTLGIDVSKNTLDIHCSEIKQHIQIQNGSEGFKNWLKWCKEHKIALEQSFIVMEHTGGYEYKLIQFCESKNIQYARIPGLAIKRSMGITRGKNDKVDAARIAQYGEEKQKTLEPAKPLNKTTIALKELLGFRKRIVREQAGYKTTLKERIQMQPELKKDFICKSLENKIKENTKLIAKLDKELMAMVEANEAIKTNYELLTSIRGIGMVNALMTIAYTENFVSFTNPRSYAVYVGVVPFDYSSGTSIRGRKKVSSIANKELKQELNQAAKSAIQWDPELREYAIRKMNNKCYGIVLNNVKFKLILRMFAVVKRKEKYVDNYTNAA